MKSLSPTEHSYWLDASPQPHFPTLEDSLSVDVAIIGGGIAGLTTAAVLTDAGLKVAVLEKNTLASGTTGGTTGKVSAQHGLIYAQLDKRFGRQKAQIYASAYSAAMRDIHELIQREGINCNWTVQDNYVYTSDPKNIKTFQKEALIAAELSLPASFEVNLDLPFKTVGAVKFADQAYFNAATYTQELAKIVQKRGSYVFEHSQAKTIKDGSPCVITTKHGSIRAAHCIVTTKIPPYPLMARFTYALNEYPHTSYIVSGRIKSLLTGMYISPDKDNYSILPINEDGERRILVGGENHIPGLGNPLPRYKKLRDYAQQHFGVEEFDFQWRAMDYMAYDSLPTVGKLYPWSKHLFVATGFKKWGLSTSMVAAKILRGHVLGHKTAQSRLWNPHRLSAPRAMPRRLAQEVKHLL